MMPERTAAIEAVRQGMEDLGGEINSVGGRLDIQERRERKRDRTLKVFGVLLVAFLAALSSAVVWAGIGVRQSAAATRANAAAIKANEVDRIQNCRAGRADLQNMAVSIVNGSADGLRKIGRANPRNVSPEAQVLVDQFAESYRQDYMAQVLKDVPRVEDCD